jgi:hypothetical protein
VERKEAERVYEELLRELKGEDRQEELLRKKKEGRKKRTSHEEFVGMGRNDRQEAKAVGGDKNAALPLALSPTSKGLREQIDELNQRDQDEEELRQRYSQERSRANALADAQATSERLVKEKAEVASRKEAEKRCINRASRQTR